jgi:hypothetical protein
MQFAKPELLFLLLAILIPIIIHLFHFRKFQIEPFTNVAFLKRINIKTRKSSKLRKWLVLILRTLAVGSIIIAFSQPFKSDLVDRNLDNEIIFYIDNSFSMQAKGVNGPLLKHTIQEIITSDIPSELITVITNDNTFKNFTKKQLKNSLIGIDYSNLQLSPKEIILKANNLFSKKKNKKDLIIISDFQKKNKDFTIPKNLNFNLFLVDKKPENYENKYISNVKFESDNSNYKISIQCKTNNDTTNSISLSLFNKNKLIGKSLLKKNNAFRTNFSLSKNESILGRFEINDNGVNYDDNFYFNIGKEEFISVLTIGNKKSDYLSKIFTKDEFLYKYSSVKNVEFEKIQNYDLIIINEVINLSNTLINELKSFMNNGGRVLFIPSIDGDLDNINNLLRIKNLKFNNLSLNKKRITEINFKHPIFKEAFKREVSNFAYPEIKKHFTTNGIFTSMLSLEDGEVFLLQKDNLFVFNSAINNKNSNFIDSPIIVPTLYGLGKSSFKAKELYYYIGEKNKFDINLKLQKNEIIKLKNNNKTYIPPQKNQNGKLEIKFDNLELEAGHYHLVNKFDTIKHLSLNFDRNESVLDYHDVNKFGKNISISSLKDSIEIIKSKVNINGLWKWFIIFALILLVLETLVLKIFE